MKSQLARIWLKHALLLLIALTCTPALLAQPVITGLNGSAFPLSGHVSITGTGLGSGGQVFIDGIQAWTSTWTPQRVVAYVPEQSTLGPTTLHLVTGGQQSNSVELTVYARQPDGRVKWSFEADGESLFWRPAEAPDGTIYIHSNDDYQGFTYALTPQGGLKWIRPVIWTAYCPPSAGPDGELYVGSINRLYRISPDGQIDWTFTAVDAQGIFASAQVGPGGLLHGGFEVAVEAFGIDPLTGELVWSNEEANISNWGTHPDGNEIRFGWSEPGGPIDRFYIYWDALYAFSLDGDHLFTTGTANNQPHEPAIGADGTLYAPGYLEYYLVAFSPEDGHILWETDADWRAHISDMEIDSGDTLYFISDGKYMHAFDPHSQSTVWRTEANTWISRPTLSPDESTLITTGGGFQDIIGFVKGFSTSTGEELWHLDLQEAFNLGYRHFPVDRARISGDGNTAYVQTIRMQWPSHDGDPRSTLFAIDVNEPAPAFPVLPEGLKLPDGVIGGGQISDLFSSDDVFLQLEPSPTKNLLKQKVNLVVQSTSPTPSPVAFTFRLESSMSGGPTGDVIRSIELMNYQTGQYELLDTRAAAITDEVVEIVPVGDPSRFVQTGTNEITVNITWKSESFSGASFRWSIDVDQAVWQVAQ